MRPIDELLILIEDPERVVVGSLLEPSDPVLGLLVHIAFSDGVLDADELALLARLRPDLSPAAVKDWLDGFEHDTFDARQLAARVEPSEAWKLMQIATRMVCMDGDVAAEEVLVLQDVAEALGLDAEAPQRAVEEVVAHGGALPQERVLASLRNMLWKRLQPSRELPEGPLATVVPDGGDHVATMSFGSDEIAALYLSGLAAMFEDGPRYVPFTDIVSYTRVPVPGASFHLHTQAAHLKMADPRMRDLGQLLDFLYGRDPIPEA